MYMLAEDRSHKEIEKKKMLWNWEENSQFYSRITCIFSDLFSLVAWDNQKL